jgi:hypothetical protein
MTCVCGVDVGSLRTLSYVAWLKDRQFVLDLYIPSVEDPLPQPPEGWSQPAYIAFDAPQGLATPGCKRRKADKGAKTPTSTLPADRKELAGWKLYKGLIEAGVTIFWAVYVQELASVMGLEPVAGCPITVLETYPRYVITRLWPGLEIPSKRKKPLKYVDTVWDRLQEFGYSCTSVLRPAVDHVDAMLCAIAAEACLMADGLPEGTVGSNPTLDTDARVLREGYIVSP